MIENIGEIERKKVIAFRESLEKMGDRRINSTNPLSVHISNAFGTNDEEGIKGKDEGNGQKL